MSDIVDSILPAPVAPAAPAEALLARARLDFHAALLSKGILSIDSNGVVSNADKSQPASRAYAAHILNALSSETKVAEKMAGQRAGSNFETEVTAFLAAAFPLLSHLRPATWTIQKVGGRGKSSSVSKFEQYAHLVDLSVAVSENPSLQAVLGNAYSIAPDIVMHRAPLTDAEINGPQVIVDETVAQLASLRASVSDRPLLHAVISCKWTMRSDRSQNARSEALNLIRNRKGRVPHIAVVTGEPTPTRISSLALGTGDLDCVYHFALPELIAAVEAEASGDVVELLAMMVEGKRLKDIADLPLDLAI
ncbi:NgoMIV family type II restriction endonuclease [Cellulomonas fimi]|uniref:NgoMIV family type II restriction endonuclease n=1 Tax=Cellulomonas fimi TaxID=1708 RepID=UPI00234C2880|nr:NgoMIV family type II restriction endonuclease [Cellulomonas fimi]MDC7120269.1 NgoMIV family type II restriction endonuclease [Cellulomonas fimi]